MKLHKLTPQAYAKACDCLKTLAHPQRLKMVQLLLQEKLTVGELAKACKMQSHVASEHLSKMKDRGLLKSEKKGRQVFYSIAEPSLCSIMSCIEKRFS